MARRCPLWGTCGPAAEVDEVAGAVHADAVHVVAHAVDDVDLEALAEVREQLARASSRGITSRSKGMRRLASSFMRASMRAEVVLGEMRAVREAEVVEEALLGGRADVVLRPGEQLDRPRLP